SDSKRDIEGISPETRVRIRVFRDSQDEDSYILIPDNQSKWSYGRNMKHFVDRVYKWAAKSQKKILKQIEDDKVLDFDKFDLIGATWRDRKDIDLAKDFFESIGLQDVKIEGEVDTFESQEDEEALPELREL